MSERLVHCKGCSHSLPVSWFPTDRSAWDNVARRCFDCFDQMGIQYRKRTWDTFRRYVEIPMLVKGCAWCGYNWSKAALHLDHLAPNDPDKFGGYLSMRKWIHARNPLPREIRAEMERCQVLCANCHAVRTQQQRSHGELETKRFSKRPTTELAKDVTQPQGSFPGV